MATYSMPDFWLGMLLLTVLRGHARAGSRWAASWTRTPTRPGSRKLADQAKHMVLPALTLTLAYLGEYALVMRSSLIDTMREDYLVLARAKGLRDALVRDRHAVPNALLPVVTLIAINFGFVLSAARSRWRRSSRGPASGWPPTRRSRVPTCRCSRACSWCSAPR